MLTSLGAFLNRHSVKVLVVSLVFIALAGWYGLGVFPKLGQGDLTDRSSESTQVVNQVNRHFSSGQAQVIVLFRAHDGQNEHNGHEHDGQDEQTVESPEFKAEVQRLLDSVQDKTASITTYYNTGAKQLVSADHRSTYAVLALSNPLSSDDGHFQAGTAGTTLPDKVAYLREHLRSDLIDVSVGGQAAAAVDIDRQVKKDLVKAEVVSFVVLAILLVFVFRSLVAAFVPLALGGFAILGAFFLTRLLADATPISQYAINIITLLGLGLAIDYSLFMVSRFREELHHSRDVSKSLTRTLETAGHTVFFSGLTVIASLLCLQIFPIDFLRSMSFGGTAAVLVAMAGALFVLPAILRLLGPKIDALSFGNVRRNAHAYQKGRSLKEQPNIWYKLGAVFMRHHWLSTAVVGGMLLAAALPFLHAHFSTPDYSSLPVGSESRSVAEQLASDFDDSVAPVHILYTAPENLKRSDQIGLLYDYVHAIRALPEVSSTASIVDLPGVQGLQAYQAIYGSMPGKGTDRTGGPGGIIPNSTHDARLHESIKAQYDQRVHGNTTMIDVNYKGSPDGADTQELVDQLRDLPKADGVQVLVGGGPAALHDLLATIKTYIPYGLTTLVIVMFVLLFLLSRSFVIAAKAILMCALSLGTAFGALVWVFQEGHWASFFNLTPTGSIDATLPVLIFAIAFGLSVDYSVFLYSRIREQYDANGGDNTDAVLTGLQKTGSIITSAATLLFIVVAAFATGHIPLMQQIGVGLALTVLIDAFIVRMVLVPSLMGILGRANWWAPRALRFGRD